MCVIDDSTMQTWPAHVHARENKIFPSNIELKSGA